MALPPRAFTVMSTSQSWTTTVVTVLTIVMGASAGQTQTVRSYESLDRSAGEAGYATAVVLFDGAVGNADYLDTELSGGRWCADAGRPTRFKPSRPSPTDAVRGGSAKLGHPVQNVTREHGLTPLPR